MATTKKKVEAKNAKSRTVYCYWPEEKIDNDMLYEILNTFYDKQNDAKEEAVSDGAREAYLYQVTVTRIAKGSQPPFSWTKE